MLPALFRDDAHVSGTTWMPYAVQFRWEDDSPIDLSDCVAKMTFRDESDAEVFTWTLGDGLEIPEPAAGDLYVNGPFPDPLSANPGLLRADLKVWWPDGTVFVDLRSELPIVEGVTE